MENDGIVSKKTIMSIGILILGGFLFFTIYAFLNDNTKQTNVPDDKVTEDDSDEAEVNIYGKYINEEDTNSYLEIFEDGKFKYVANGCEGYFSYTESNYKMELKRETGKVTISLSSISEAITFTFESSLIESNEIKKLTGTMSCSSSNIYIRS